MNRFLTGLVVLAALLAGGCGGTETCDEPEFYESARAGQRIVTPDDLSNLSASRELVIPQASPRPPRAPGSGCLDRPPSLRVEPEEE